MDVAAVTFMLCHWFYSHLDHNIKVCLYYKDKEPIIVNLDIEGLTLGPAALTYHQKN